MLNVFLNRDTSTPKNENKQLSTDIYFCNHFIVTSRIRKKFYDRQQIY